MCTQRELWSAIWLQLLCHLLSGKSAGSLGLVSKADTFILLGMAFYSPEVNYLDATLLLIWLQRRKALYETYEGSPISKGTLQPDIWGVTPSNQWDWVALRAIIEKNEVRNSLLVAPMPTTLTSQILGNNECLELYTSNIYSRSVLSGEFVVVNKHLLHDLTEMGLWSPLKNQIIYEDGFVPKIPEIPDELKLIYKTVWEIKQRTLVDMAADRGCYIDQSQSLNIHMDQPNFGKLTSMHFYAWSKFISLHISDLICLCVLIDYLTYTDTQGLKIGMYNLDHVQRLVVSSSLLILPCSK
nr:ribonucleoside-diphosphate reductase large subunit-like [Ipomoea batatas]